MSVCCDCCVSSRGFCDELITCPEERYRLWYVVVCDLKPAKMAMARFEPKRHRGGKMWIKKMRCLVNIYMFRTFHNI